MSPHIASTYAELLMPHAPGFALWMPSPFDSDPIPVRENGIEIGDIGVITAEGEFKYLFNVCDRGRLPNPTAQLPTDFPVIDPGHIDERDEHFQAGEEISTSSYEVHTVGGGGNIPAGTLPVAVGLRVEYSSSADRGALLRFPAGAKSSDVRNINAFRELAEQNALLWYDLARDQLGDVDINGSLYLVTGHVKSKAWAIAAHRDLAGGVSFALNANSFEMVGGEVEWSYRWDNHTHVNTRAGPGRFGRLSRPNQCAIVRGFKMRITNSLFRGELAEVIAVSDSNVKAKNAMPTYGKFIPKWVKSIRMPGGQSSRGSGSSGSTRNASLGPVADAIQSSSSVSPSPPTNVVQTMVERVPKEVEIYHPSNRINQLLLEKFDKAKIAITHDEDWYPILSKLTQDTLPSSMSDEELFQAMKQMYSVKLTPEGCVYFDSCSTRLNLEVSSLIEELKSDDVRETRVMTRLEILVDDDGYTDVINNAWPDIIEQITINRATSSELPGSSLFSFSFREDASRLDRLFDLWSTNEKLQRGFADAIPRLTRLLGNDSTRVSRSAMGYLAKLEHLHDFKKAVHKSTSTLVDLLNKGDYSERRKARDSLLMLSESTDGEFDDVVCRAIPIIADMLSDLSGGAGARETIERLSKIDRPEIQNTVLSILS